MKPFHQGIKSLCVLFVLIPLSWACKKDVEPQQDLDHPPTYGGVLQQNASLVREEQITSIDSATVKLHKSTLDRRYFTGHVLLIPPHRGNPDGDMRKILSITESGSVVSFRTTYAAFHEAFDHVEVQSFSSIANHRDSARLRVAGEGFDLKLALENTVLAEGIKLSGLLSFHIDPFFEYKKLSGSVRPEKMAVGCKLQFKGGGLEMSTADGREIILRNEKVLHTFKLPDVRVIIPIPTPVGIFPFPVPFGNEIRLKTMPIAVKGKVSVQMDTQLEATLGAGYNAGGWKDLSNFSMGGINLLNPCKSAMSGEVTVEGTMLKLEYVLKPLKLNALQLAVGASENIHLKTNTNKPFLTLEAAAKIFGEVKTDFFTSDNKAFIVGGDKEYFKTKISSDSTQKLPMTASVFPEAGKSTQRDRWVNGQIRPTYISWSPVERATNYNVEIQIYAYTEGKGFDWGPYSEEPGYETTNTYYYFNGLGMNPHRFRIKAKNPCSESEPTEWAVIEYTN